MYITILHDKMRNIIDNKSLIEEVIFKTLEEKKIKMNIDRKTQFNIARINNMKIIKEITITIKIKKVLDKCNVKNRIKRNHNV